MPRIAALQQLAALEILVYLLDAKEARVTQMMKKINASQKPVYRALLLLKENGLIAERISEEPLAKLFILTEKGRKVAELLTEIEKVLMEEKKGEG